MTISKVLNEVTIDLEGAELDKGTSELTSLFFNDSVEVGLLLAHFLGKLAEVFDFLSELHEHVAAHDFPDPIAFQECAQLFPGQFYFPIELTVTVSTEGILDRDDCLGLRLEHDRLLHVLLFDLSAHHLVVDVKEPEGGSGGRVAATAQDNFGLERRRADLNCALADSNVGNFRVRGVGGGRAANNSFEVVAVIVNILL